MPSGIPVTGASDDFFFRLSRIPRRGMECSCTSKHRVWSPKHRLLGGAPPNTPFERMEVFMEGLFFAIGFLLGGVAGVLIMCLLQINRIGRKEDSEE